MVIIDFFVPDNMRGNEEDLKSARLSASLNLGWIGTGVIYAPTLFLLGNFYAGIMGSIALTLWIINLFVLKAGFFKVQAHGMLGILYVVLPVFAFSGMGLNDVNVVWYVLFPYLAMLIFDKKEGLAWLCLSLLGIGIIIIVDMFGQAYTVEPPAAYKNYMPVIGYPVFAICVYALAQLSKFLQGKALQEKQAAVNEAELALKAKSAFLATMSHEIRTPLNGVIGFTDLMEGTNLDEEQKDYLHYIKTSGDSLLELISNILDYSKIEAGKINLETVPIQLNRCVEEALDIVSHRAYEKGIELTCFLDPSSSITILGDPTRLRQVLINLLGNAIKFTEKGEVSLTVRCECENGQNLHNVVFSVKDSGIGIPEDKLATIFESFTQADSSTSRQYGGTGLGLAICKRLVERMGGSIQVSSQVNKGSTFMFNIHAETGPEQHDEIPNFHRLKDQRLLIVGLAQMTRNQIQVHCTKHGISCTETPSLTELNEFRPLSYDIVLSEYKMPGSDGCSLASTLRQKGYKGTILMLANPAERPKNAAAAIDQWINKPLKIHTLLDSMATSITREQGELAFA